MEKVIIYGPISVIIMGTGLRIRSADKVLTRGQMVGNMKGNG